MPAQVVLDCRRQHTGGGKQHALGEEVVPDKHAVKGAALGGAGHVGLQRAPGGVAVAPEEVLGQAHPRQQLAVPRLQLQDVQLQLPNSQERLKMGS